MSAVYTATILPLDTGLQNYSVGTIAISVTITNSSNSHADVVTAILEAVNSGNFFNPNLVNLSNTAAFSISP